MDGKNQFLMLIREVKRKLVKQHFFSAAQYMFLFTAAVIFLVSLAARWLVLVNVIWWTLVPAFFTAAAVMYHWVKNSPGDKKAIHLYDQAVRENRVATAYDFLGETNGLALLQRQEAVTEMKRKKQVVLDSRKLKFHWKECGAALLLVCGTTASVLFPSEQMLVAADLQANKQMLKMVGEDLENLEEQEDDQLDEVVNELKEQLEEKETAEAALEELLLAEALLEEMKLELEMSEEQLQQYAEALKKSGFNELAKALKTLHESALNEAAADIRNEIGELTQEERQALADLFEQLSGESAGSPAELTDEELFEMLEKLEEQLAQLMEEALTLEALASLQEQLQQAATALNTSMANAGLSENRPLTFASASSGSPSAGVNPPAGQGGSNDESGTEGSGSGGNSGSAGQGSGSGPGQGQGQGGGSGSGGSGSGAGGRGAGSGQGPRELVTVPERISGQENVEGDQGETGSGSGERYESETAPVLKGTVRPYREVIGEYEANYRESVDRMQLPGYLEGVVRDYFSELNMEEE
ncbi:hypothetical protein MM300_10260 [Evansella sp. LMS18]|jgi:chemotaxis protein histidine kinase CheA|uniref:hypothetical protein n=1 Tax=Evansella sp. LMS18 TaxID=2924033 RepID=UPI0020D033C0|nr:hypothetical protein [Evansella sp. LMS18]UTR12619.1 hypothetical protein MM300_10260 [Evansella sp. LMS18]